MHLFGTYVKSTFCILPPLILITLIVQQYVGNLYFEEGMKSRKAKHADD